MKKIMLTSIILLLVLVGCEERHYDAVGPYPTDEEGIIERFDSLGWVAYNGGDYDLAYARFDSSVKMDASNSNAYVGLGFTNIQLGKFDGARSSFGFVPTLEGGSPIVEVEDGGASWTYWTPDSTLIGLVIAPGNIPILGVLEPVVHFKPDSLNPAPEQDLEVFRITDNTIVTEPTVDNGGHNYIPTDSDTFKIDYAYFDGDLSRTLALACAGYAQAAQIQGKSDPEDLLDAMIYAKAVLVEYGDEGSLRADTLEVPDYIDPSVTTRNVRILLAQSYFYYGYLYNCMWELWRLDPDLIDDFDPESPSFERDLQSALENL